MFGSVVIEADFPCIVHHREVYHFMYKITIELFVLFQIVYHINFIVCINGIVLSTI